MVSRVVMALIAAGGLVASTVPAYGQDESPAPATAPVVAKESTGKVGEKIPSFAAKVLRADKEIAFDSSKQSKVTVYYLAGVACSATLVYAERLAALSEAYGARGIEFVFIYPGARETAADKRKFHKEKKLGGAFLDDADGAIAKKLGSKRTAEALICDKEGKVLYRGGVDDNPSEPTRVRTKYVAQALDEILAGKSVSVTTGKVYGDKITFRQ